MKGMDSWRKRHFEKQQRGEWSGNGRIQEGGETIKCVVWNVRGSKSFGEIKTFLEEYDIIILQETWLDKEKANYAIRKLSGNYNYWSKDAVRKREGTKKGRLAGGQIVALKKIVMDEWKVNEWMGGLCIKNGNKKCIITIYVNEGMRKVEEKLYEVMEECMGECELVILCGDMNARIGEANVEMTDEYNEGRKNERKSQDKKIDEEGKRLLRMCNDLGLVVMNGRANGDREGKITYIGGGEEYAGSVIDLVLMVDRGNTEEMRRMEIIERNESDHLPVSFEIEGGKKGKVTEANEEVAKERIIWKKEKEGKFTEKIARKMKEKRWEGKENKWEKLKEMIWETVRGIGMVTNKKRRNANERRGWSAEYREAKRENWEKLKEWLKNRCKQKRRIYVKSRRKLKKIRKEEEKRWTNERWEELDKARDMGGWWKAMNKFRGQKRER